MKFVDMGIIFEFYCVKIDLVGVLGKSGIILSILDYYLILDILKIIFFFEGMFDVYVDKVIVLVLFMFFILFLLN